jgi:hypothetical protein
MIFEFLLPIIGWLILFLICFVIYSQVFYKNVGPQKHVEGQALYTALASFFWITVYMCLSSIWSILYSLIDLKYPDVIGAASNYGSGLTSVGAVYDTFAFPLALVVVSSITACVLGFFLISKFEKNEDLRPDRLYTFMRALVFIGGAVMIFSGFVYVVYSWLYGNLVQAVIMKGIVAFAIVGMVALYFYLTGDGKNKNEGVISRVFAILLVVVTLATMFYSFNIIGTPTQARLYRLDSITLQNLQNVKNEIDNQEQNFGVKIKDLKEINADYAKGAIRQTQMTYSSNETDYTLCAQFNSEMPQTINIPDRNVDWDYHAGQSCFTFKHLPPYPNAVNNAKPTPVVK